MAIPSIKDVSRSYAVYMGHSIITHEDKLRPRLQSCLHAMKVTGRERVALVQFRGGVPQFQTELTTNPLGDWQIHMGDEGVNFDSHFFGFFTQLYALDEKEPVIAESGFVPLAMNRKSIADR